MHHGQRSGSPLVSVHNPGEMLPYLLLAGRLLFVAFFLESGIRNLRRRGAVAEKLTAPTMPSPFRRYPRFFSIASSLLLLAGSVMVGLGAYADVGALLLAFFLVPTTYASHPFWRHQDGAERRHHVMGFLRNLTFFGGCLFLFAFFAGYGHGLALMLTDPLLTLR